MAHSNNPPPDRSTIHAANQRRWNAAAPNWAQRADNRGLWPRCPAEPDLVLSPTVLRYLGDPRDQQVAVLGSGDNQVVFALAGMGARVTSVDISQAQLAIAADRARQLDLEITFVQSDVTALDTLADERFDFVYTGGHVAVWVADLNRYYAEAVRILRPGGLFLVDEYHPFRRGWRPGRHPEDLHREAGYFDRGPFRYRYDADVLHPAAGDLESFEFHWTVADFCNAILRTGATLLEVAEYGTQTEDWEGAPLAGLPELLLLVARK